ncbi:MAG: phage Gp37/Gp68 family protein [Chloroflexi bacterium HGW-Chloroflexi-5]|nr:MAG: phage Gp37/Gp68 family protein [Chloroflexi bacterium HGW-Chloroflexi-5]
MTNGSQWWDQSWNPVTGCTMVSEGCANCYAKAMHERFMQSTMFEKVVLHPERLSKIDKTKPKVIFVDSMSDLFHEAVPFEFISEVFSVMQRNPLHTFVVLTKRAKRMFEYFMWEREFNPEWKLFYPLENVWLGVTAENQERANERIPLLLKTPAKYRFVSVEPMLESVDLTKIKWARIAVDKTNYDFFGAPAPDEIWSLRNVLDRRPGDEYNRPLIGVDFVICGGESGPGARLMRPEWARALRDQCLQSDVPFFFKQWGAWVPDMLNDYVMVRSHMTGIGRKLDGVEWNYLPWRKPAKPVLVENQLSFAEVK